VFVLSFHERNIWFNEQQLLLWINRFSDQVYHDSDSQSILRHFNPFWKKAPVLAGNHFSKTSGREPEVLRRVSPGKSVCKSVTGKAQSS